MKKQIKKLIERYEEIIENPSMPYNQATEMVYRRVVDDLKSLMPSERKSIFSPGSKVEIVKNETGDTNYFPESHMIVVVEDIILG